VIRSYIINSRHLLALLQFLLLTGLVFVGGASSAMNNPLEPKEGFNMTQLERDRYLVKIAGCNDCNTPGYLLVDGQVAE
jgi:hypothetical protein